MNGTVGLDGVAVCHCNHLTNFAILAVYCTGILTNITKANCCLQS